MISQIQAPQIPLNDRRRRSINVTNESLNINNISSLITNNNYNNMKKLAKRSADGTRGCTQTGAAVMVNRTQVNIFFSSFFHNYNCLF